ncbi:hypothetical protein N865_10505 [Intrasporangium oryzae NRRL B-24470]|uniref:Uncharacterized protein n=1 Tax=Intrasporangium oryzae NRRL B-24470 TaxID=1386089 RepID=W9G5W3_9MICO|nr:hypothetical protein [Intrasporangium oryzae]EWT01425.1 hypothetical protein N865_10505 [Intrasporangium oryzae NRRL B-24470]
MDTAKQLAFVEHVRSRGGATAQVAVTLEHYFDGNDCEWCIAPNRSQDIDLDTVRRVLFALRDRPEVHDVRVELDVLEFQTFPDDEWPFASGVAVITTLTPEEVDALTIEVDTDPSGGPSASVDWLVDAPAIPEGYHYVGVWWD